MQDAIVSLPAMYADHHVMAVRGALLGLPGVADVLASAAIRSVRVRFDETALSPQEIEAALSAAGYAPDQEVQVDDHPLRHRDGSSWYTVIDRTAQTIMKDREMAGDFRRY